MKIYAKLILENDTKVWVRRICEGGYTTTEHKYLAHVFRNEKAARAVVQMLDSKVRMKIVAEICENDISTLSNSKYGSGHWFGHLISIIHDAAIYATSENADPIRAEKYTKQSLTAITELNENKYLLKYVKQ